VTGILLENILYEKDWLIDFDLLHEATYVKNIFTHLKEIMGSDFKRFQFVYYTSNGNQNPPQPIVLTDPRPKILIWGGDESAATPPYMSKYFVSVFKPYLKGDRNAHGYHHFPLGYSKNVPELEMIPINSRKMNVFFSGNLNLNRFGLYSNLAGFDLIHRRLLVSAYFRLNRMMPKNFSNKFPDSYIQFTDGFAKGLPGDEYSRYLYNSKIVICPPGFSINETFRHFEALRAGAIPISLRMPDNHFHRGSPIVMLETWRELTPTIRNFLNNPGKMEETHHKCVDWWENVCSEKAVAKYMATTIAEDYAKYSTAQTPQ